jgi:hypothetical protein
MTLRRLVDRHQNNPRHQHDDSWVARGLEQGIRVEQATQGQPPAQPLDPVAAREQERRQLALATERMRQVNVETQRRLRQLDDVQETQNQQSGQETDTEDSEELQEHVVRSIYNRYFLRRD